MCVCVFFFFFRNFFRIFKTKILYYIFMTIFIFYEALKKSRVFLFHLIKLLINFDKEIRRQLHFLLIQVHLFKNTRNVFFLKLIRVKRLICIKELLAKYFSGKFETFRNKMAKMMNYIDLELHQLIFAALSSTLGLLRFRNLSASRTALSLVSIKMANIYEIHKALCGAG